MEYRNNIIWSPSAKEDLENVTDYLKFRWGTGVTEKFLLRLNRIIRQVSINPRQYAIINSELQIRKCVVTKQNTIYYRIRKKEIEMVRLFDSRQDPKKLKIFF